MRVTNKMLSNSFLSDMRTNLENMQKLQQQMTSGKEISKPSDDPARVARAMQLNTNINTNQQYNKNISDASNWLDTTDTALGQAGDTLTRIKELLTSAGNAAYGSDERQSIKDEINQKIDEFAQILNTNFDGKYIFGGSRGNEKPMAANEDSTTKNTILKYNVTDASDGSNEMNQINQKLYTEISQGVTMDYNVSATDIVQFRNDDGNSDNADNIMDLFKNITDHLDDANATSKLTGSDLQDITDAISNLLKNRSQVGAKENRMESAKSKNEDETQNLTKILTQTEDIDITEKTMEYATLQTVYTASLQTSARVIQPSLLDYLT